MSNELYYRGSSTYEVAVKNKLDALERSGTRNAAAMMAGLRNMEYGIRSDIRESTYAIVASQEMLAQTYKQGFDSINNTLDLGFEKMAFGMNNIANGMNDIANSISAMSDAICSKLDELHGIMSNPRLTAARELFRRAADNFEKGYFEEALEDCKQAVEKEKTDFISWFLLGQIYLYGAGKFSNVIDLQKAEESLQNAAKYIDSDIGTSNEADSLASQIYYELGHTQLMISNDLLVEGKNQESQEKLEKAEKATRESFKIDSTKLEAIYENAKELHFLGKDDECLKLLETLIYSEKGYALKASCDKNFESIWSKIDEVIKGIKDSRVKVVKRDLEDLNNSVQNGISANYSDKWTSEFKGIKFIIDSILSVIDNKDFFYVTDIQDQKLPELSEKVEDAHKGGNDYKAEHKRKIEENVKIASDFKFLLTKNIKIQNSLPKNDFLNITGPSTGMSLTKEDFDREEKYYFSSRDPESSYRILSDAEKFYTSLRYEMVNEPFLHTEFYVCWKDYVEALEKKAVDDNDDSLKALVDACRELYRSLPTEAEKQEQKRKTKKGCYVATCVYGSYDCPSVWTLRRFRDNTLGATWYGRLFIKIYYAVSPTLVKWFGHTNWFKNMWKPFLDRLVNKLQKEGVENTPYDDKCWR